MFDLTNKVVLITGATGGIGGAIAKKMKQAGAKVVVSGRNIAKLESEFDDSYIKIPADLAEEGAAVELVMNTIEQAGKIDIVVNNAGITKDTLIMRMTDEQFDDVINTNLRSCFKMCRAVIMPMMKQRFGSIVNTTSVVGVYGNVGQANYSAAKAGLIGFTKSLAKELGARNIRVNAVAPGFIATDMTKDLANIEEYLKLISLKRLGTAQDVAQAVKFLAVDSQYVTGQVLEVDGGMII